MAGNSPVFAHQVERQGGYDVDSHAGASDDQTFSIKRTGSILFHTPRGRHGRLRALFHIEGSWALFLIAFQLPDQ